MSKSKELLEMGAAWNRISDAKINRREVSEEDVVCLTKLLAQNPDLLNRIVEEHKNGNRQRT